MDKQWFVLNTLTGQENKAQKSIEVRTKSERMEEFIGRCVIPTEKVTEKKDGRRRTLNRKVFPGYVLCELALYDDSKGLDENGKRQIFERTWQFLRETPGVIGFVGSVSRVETPQPIPLKPSEVEAILSDKPLAAAQASRPVMDFAVDETVKITDGAFMGLTGQVSVVDSDKGKLKVEVQVFGRKVPVDVEGWQVEKVPVGDALEPAD